MIFGYFFKRKKRQIFHVLFFLGIQFYLQLIKYIKSFYGIILVSLKNKISGQFSVCNKVVVLAHVQIYIYYGYYSFLDMGF